MPHPRPSITRSLALLIFALLLSACGGPDDPMPDSLQSPIDIAAPVTRDDLPPLDFRYPAGIAVTAELVVQRGDPIDGRARAIVQVVVTPPRGAAELRLDGVAYILTSLHWHTPAEHTIDGRRPPMELHLVHAGPDGGILVVGVLYAEGPANPALAPVFDRLAALGDATAVAVPALDLADLLPPPDRRASYRYQGSLTTADAHGRFRDGVQWVVLREPVAAAPAQLDAHRALVDAPLSGLDRPNPPGNARALQPRAARRIASEG